MNTFTILQREIRSTLLKVGIDKSSKSAVHLLNFYYVYICLMILKRAAKSSKHRVTSNSIYKYLKKSRVFIRKSKSFQNECDQYTGPAKTPSYYKRKLKYYAKLQNCSFIGEDEFSQVFGQLRKYFVFRTDLSESTLSTLHKGTEAVFVSFLRTIVKTTLQAANRKVLTNEILQSAWESFITMRDIPKINDDKMKRLLKMFGVKNRKKSVGKSRNAKRESATQSDSETQSNIVDTKDSETQSDIIDTNDSETQSNIIDTKDSETQSDSVDTKDSETQSDIADTKDSETQSESQSDTVDTKDSETQSDTADTKDSETQNDTVDTKDSETQSDIADTKDSETQSESRSDITDTKDSETQSDTADTKDSETQSENAQQCDPIQFGYYEFPSSRVEDKQLEAEESFRSTYSQSTEQKRSQRPNKSIPARRFDPSTYISQSHENAARLARERE
jgi:serine-aspartate repeat-containing protein C/D/E